MRRAYLVAASLTVAALIVLSSVLVFRPTPAGSTTTTSETSTQSTAGKPIILYVNQGNGAVNQSNFAQMLAFASGRGFNTVFFQVYREGSLLFGSSQLASFVLQSHVAGLRIFFALYFTDPSQAVPYSVFGLGEDGISLDMSSLPVSSQSSILTEVRGSFVSGQVAITTTDFSLPLSANLVVFETYGLQDQSYIHPGIVGSVGVFATTSRSDYEQQFQYALQNSDGVMVFDYAGLLKSGY